MDPNESLLVEPNTSLQIDPNFSLQMEPNTSLQMEPNTSLQMDPNISLLVKSNKSLQVEPQTFPSKLFRKSSSSKLVTRTAIADSSSSELEPRTDYPIPSSVEDDVKTASADTLEVAHFAQSITKTIGHSSQQMEVTKYSWKTFCKRPAKRPFTDLDCQSIETDLKTKKIFLEDEPLKKEDCDLEEGVIYCLVCHEQVQEERYHYGGKLILIPHGFLISFLSIYL